MFVTAGAIRLGNRLYGPGTALAIAAGTVYGFEAAATGLPAVTTDVGSCREIIEGFADDPVQGRGGFVVPACNPKAMAEALATTGSFDIEFVLLKAGENSARRRPRRQEDRVA